MFQKPTGDKYIDLTLFEAGARAGFSAMSCDRAATTDADSKFRNSNLRKTRRLRPHTEFNFRFHSRAKLRGAQVNLPRALSVFDVGRREPPTGVCCWRCCSTLSQLNESVYLFIKCDTCCRIRSVQSSAPCSQGMLEITVHSFGSEFAVDWTRH
jgi:hypothetical protein